jgi:redox-sensitive bicupin YhaK (pirin superfamily)
VGESHPHAGLETVTLILEGSLDDAAEGLLNAGDLAWMTAGRGVIHNEDVKATGKARILQLWLMLPAALRDSDPELQIVPLSTIPVRREPGVEARLYSGSTGALRSPTRNRVPVTMVDFTLAPAAAVAQDIPGAYTGFLYVIDGTVRVGDEVLSATDVGWLDRNDQKVTHLQLQAGPGGARVVLYVGQPQDEPLVPRGPFVAGSREEITAYFTAYRAGSFRRLSEIAGAPARTSPGKGAGVRVPSL